MKLRRKPNFELIAVFWFFMCASILFVSRSGNARDINWDKLEEKAKKYTGGQGIRRPGQQQGGTVDLVLPSQPTSRPMFPEATEMSAEDKRYVEFHMRLANSHFRRKNYDRAISEAELVFTREADHSGARFMRAVIAARLKDHDTAWQNILVAREKDPGNEKIKSFIDKLKTVAKEPQTTLWVPGILRPIPISASEKAADIIESFLKNPVSQNVTNLTTEEFQQKGSSVWLPVKLESSSPINQNQILEAFKKATGANIETDSPDTDSQSPTDKSISLKLEIRDMPLKNPDVKPVSDLREYIKGLTEDIDVAISDTMERDAENRTMDVTYEISVRDFKTLNDFLRTISAYAHTYRVLDMKLAFITGSQSIIWKCKVQVFFQLS